MKTKQSYCKSCGVRFEYERSSKQYCSESCRQRAKYARSKGLSESAILNHYQAIANDLISFQEKYMTENHSPEMKLQLKGLMDRIHYQLDVTQAFLDAIKEGQKSVDKNSDDPLS